MNARVIPNADKVLTFLPQPVREVLLSAPEVEFATLSARGQPISNPLFHYFGDDGSTIDVATGLAYPAKAERARRNPRVGLLFAPEIAAQDPIVNGAFSRRLGGTAAGTDTPASNGPVVLVAAIAAVRDADIQANTDRYVEVWLRDHPELVFLPWEQERQRVYYYARLWIQCAPVRIWWWPDGLSAVRYEWQAPSDMPLPVSDPAPAAAPTPVERWPVADWRAVAQQVLDTISRPTLAVVDDEGFPVPLPTQSVRLTENGFAITLPSAVPCSPRGPACLTFAVAATFLGAVSHVGAEIMFSVERVIGNLPLAGNDAVSEDSPQAQHPLMQRLQAELQRRNQPLPQVRRR